MWLALFLALLLPTENISPVRLSGAMCTRELVVVATDNQDGIDFERIERFWQEAVPWLDVRIVGEEPQYCGATVLRLVDLSRTQVSLQYFRHRPRYAAYVIYGEANDLVALFHAPELVSSSSGNCYHQGVIVLLPRARFYSIENAEAVIVHEIGHALGLVHREETIMTRDAPAPWHLDESQKEGLLYLYTSKLYPQH